MTTPRQPTTVTDWANVPFGLAHELCHYLTARLLGFDARLHWFCVTFYPPTLDWRVQAVVLAPAVAGLLAWAGVVVFAWHKDSWLLAGLAGAWLLLWEARCGRDFYCAWQVWRNRRWPDDAAGPQTLFL